jgi:hypothetical protein
MKSAHVLLEDLLREDLEAANCSLRCVNAPIVCGDDCDIVWEVVEYHMSEPVERIIGSGMSPIDALNDAFGS